MMYRVMCVLTLAAALVWCGAARASDPIGGYLIADKVVLAPEGAPTTIQIWGSFSLATQRGGKAYGEPERGYLYYKASEGTEATCRREWNDLYQACRELG